MAESGEDIRGEDNLEGATLPFAVRFHLHPNVIPSMQQDGRSVVLRLPGGSIWSLRAKGGAITLEESVYLGGPEQRPTQQIVLTVPPTAPEPEAEDTTPKAEWAITKVG